METEVKSVSLTSTDWAAIDAHAKDMATNRSHALRLIIKEWAERRFVPITMTTEQHQAEREAGNSKPQPCYACGDGHDSAPAGCDCLEQYRAGTLPVPKGINVCRECDKPAIDCEFCLVTKDSR